MRFKSQVFLFSITCFTFALPFFAKDSPPSPADPKYTVDFRNVPMEEVVRFASKISHTNFIFTAKDLQFNTTLVSGAPISAKDLLTAIAQLLQAHNLTLLEQDRSLLVTPSRSVKQIPSLSFLDNASTATFATQIFHIQHANPVTIASVIRPLSGSSCLLEIFADPRLLIITDLVANLEKIETLISCLDVPNTQIEIQSYISLNLPTHRLIPLAEKILDPFTKNTPFFFVSKPNSSEIFIISTPFLGQKAISILRQLDFPFEPFSNAPIEMFFYPCLHKAPENVLEALHAFDSKSLPSSLRSALQSTQTVAGTNSLLFFAPASDEQKIKDLLSSFDQLSPALPTWSYSIQHVSYQTIKEGLLSLSRLIDDPELSKTIANMQWVQSNHSLVFQGSERCLQQIQNIVPSFDRAEPILKTSYVFRVLHSSKDSFRLALEQFSSTVQDPELSQALRSMEWNEGNHSYLFKGSPAAISELESILPSMDIPSQVPGSFYLYPVQNIPGALLQEKLQTIGKKVHSADLKKTLLEAQWIPDSQSILFKGPPSSLEEIKKLLSSLDTPSSLPSSQQTFLRYKPSFLDGEVLYKDTQNLSSELKQSGSKDIPFLNALDSATWNSSQKILFFQGDPSSLNSVKSFLLTLDQASPSSESMPFFYSTRFASPEKFQDSLQHFSQTISPDVDASKALLETLRSAERIPGTNTFLFLKDKSSTLALDQILKTLDVPPNDLSSDLYKVQGGNGPSIIKHLQTFAEGLSFENPEEAPLKTSLETLEWIEKGRAIVVSGSPQTISSVKKMLSELDASLSKTGLPPDSFTYTPKNHSSDDLIQSLKDLSSDLEQSSQIDPSFASSLASARVVPGGKSIIFFGTPDSLKKVEQLLTSLDFSEGTLISSDSSEIFIYKIHNAPASNLLRSLKKFTQQLKKSSGTDKDLLHCLNSVQWIKETNSLLLKGSPHSLQQVKKLLPLFDKASPSRSFKEASYLLYRPKNRSGEDLIQTFDELKHNLESSGVSDPGLFLTIDQLVFLDSTNTIIVAGPPSSLEKIKELLGKFDLPEAGSSYSSISTINNANFLSYKLQTRQGPELLAALQKVAASLAKNSSENNQALIECLGSLQWIETTHSVLGSGSIEILENVRALISSLDAMLKQVFIEVLVIQTTLANSQTIGLQWGSQLQYLNKTIGAVGNFPNGSNLLSSPLQSTTATTPPIQGTGSSNGISFTNGFDIGVIGDIIFHKGQSFLSLGSLFSAIQSDSDSTIVMNPKILTQDGATSSVFVGLNIPFVGSVVSNTMTFTGGTPQTIETSNLEYRDVGFSLSLTPTLGLDNTVTLEIHQDISQQVPLSSSSGNTQLTGIETSRTTMSTKVQVPDRHFLILSGMIQDQKNHSRQGIPCLGGLPVIGALFAQDTIAATTPINVVIFMKPYILHSTEDLEHLQKEQEGLFKNAAILPDVQETVESAIEKIKAVE